MRYSGMTITLKDWGVRVKQVNRANARKAYNEGKTIYLNSCNMRLNNPWQGTFRANMRDYDETFEACVNNFEYYNCDAERGKYANFFVEV